MVYSFQATVAARGYQVYKNKMWEQVKIADKVLVEIESDKKPKRNWSVLLFPRKSINQQLKTVGHIAREISRHVYFFPKDEHGHIDGTVKSIDYRPSPVPTGGLEIPLTLNFKSPRYIPHTRIDDFMSILYSFDYNENKEDERDEPSSDEEINLLIKKLLEESQSNSEVVIQARRRIKHLW